MQGPVQIDFSGTKQDNEVKLSLKGTSSSYLLLHDKSDDLDLHVLSGQGQGHPKMQRSVGADFSAVSGQNATIVSE